ncbi:hypothetical protein [Arthrobacter sp. UCD-GKA]|uniref:hypothetical protein n=1 Tax=Arthrobacter sp. UCD-GKA TaxID=1913576 RepID=UPI001114454E|nr:hypothetical protein [Arthrobacter sp. UCD-GKA]
MSARRTGDVGIWADLTPEDFPSVNLLAGASAVTITELEARIERLSHAVRKLAGWSGNDIADLIEDGLIMEGDLS